MQITFPRVLSLDERRARNTIRQIGESSCQLEGALIPFTRDRIRGFLFRAQDSGEETLVIPQKRRIPENHLRAIKATVTNPTGPVDICDGTWIKHPSQDATYSNHDHEIQAVMKSWIGAFRYVEEDAKLGTKGLRPPQIGAIHAVHAHWSVSDEPATIVMPTGTGKTETMLSILVSVCCPRLIVVVPTHALRAQITEKFLTLGILKERGCKVLSPTARYPIVGMLQHVPRNTGDVDDVFSRCHIIVTTSSIAGQCDGAVQDRMAYYCPYLFLDEAHHTEAPTWRAFKEKFRGRRVLQFTATPFREDGKPLDGKLIFKYPLKKAQQEGYFKRIHFRPVSEFQPQRSDLAIAAKAIEELRADMSKGHILMARVATVDRANEVFRIYSQYSEFKPVELHSGIKTKLEREAARNQILSGESRIVVCVDMLGEGFDLPELKIAAFHDIRKSLAVTLQLAGRFTRSRPDLGDATFIANIADVQVQEELRKLYSRDPDWNALLPELSAKRIGEQESLQEFLQGFGNFTKDIPLKTVRPAVSTVVYQTRCTNWTPENFRKGFPGINECSQVYETVNEKEHTLVVVTARRGSLEWTDVEILSSLQWELYVVIWSPELRLLFINSSTKAGEYRDFAKSVAGDDVTLISGQQVFRAFAGVSRLRLQNVGLSEQIGRNIRYTGRMGADVESALPNLQKQRARKSVLSGNGFMEGKRITIGASRKGRIWSHQRDSVEKLALWCRGIGEKLLDTSIDPDEVLEGTLDAKTVVERPYQMPIAADWPEEMYKTTEATWSIVLGGQEELLSDVDISIVSPTLKGAIRLAISCETEQAEVELELFVTDEVPDYRFVVQDGRTALVRRGMGKPRSLASFFYEYPPIIWFTDGSSLDGNQYTGLKHSLAPYDPGKIQVWDWDGVDIRKESQGLSKDTASIQARVIRELKKRDYDLIIDDDGKGEAADVVTIRRIGDRAAPATIEVGFYHCKYSHASTPGQRIADLYEVCGQAQKSVGWRFSEARRTDLFTHLLRREASRQASGRVSRYERGTNKLLETIREMSRQCPVTLEIFVVQPGVSKQKVSLAQLHLMSVTENYLAETYQLPFGVIASA